MKMLFVILALLDNFQALFSDSENWLSLIRLDILIKKIKYSVRLVGVRIKAQNRQTIVIIWKAR
jgi:hypothetical protein